MSTIVTRAGKGSPLTHNEVDANFTNLNTDKYQSGDAVTFASAVVIGSATINGTSIPNNKTLVVTTDIGASVQAYDAQLADIAGLTPTDNNFIVGNGTNFVTESGSTARTSLGLGSIATQDANNVSITGGSVSGITDLAVADGGTGASDASTARTNLGLAIGTNVQAYSAELQGATQGGINGMKNRIINGAMVIDQRNAGASVSTSSATNGTFQIDRWKTFVAGTAVVTAQQSSTAPTGFINSQSYTVATADTSIAAGDLYVIEQPIEGLNCSDLSFGSASASTMTLSFWVQSSITGTYCGALTNSAENRAYIFTYTISSANTWEQKTVTIAGDTSGTWLTTSGIGIRVRFTLSAGNTFQGTANTWSAANVFATSSQTQWVSTLSATFYITGVQLEVGSTATSFDYRPYGTELALCQRYCYVTGGSAYSNFFSGFFNTTTDFQGPVVMPVTMRSSPTLTTTGNFQVISNSTFSASSLSLGASETTQMTAKINGVVSGATAGYGGTMRANNDTTAKLILSAEL